MFESAQRCTRQPAEEILALRLEDTAVRVICEDMLAGQIVFPQILTVPSDRT